MWPRTTWCSATIRSRTPARHRAAVQDARERRAAAAAVHARTGTGLIRRPDARVQGAATRRPEPAS
jgi:hypothetical protein